MHTGDYIRSVKFDHAMRGYKTTDVEMFLDEVAEDIDKLIAQNRALNERLSALMKEQEAGVTPAPQKVDSSDSIENVQSILVSAQRFSDQIVNEANEKAAAILYEANTKAKEIDEKVANVLEAFEKDIAERKANADAEISKMLSDAAVKSEGIITAAHDSVARQQLLFDKIKFEVAEFKKSLFENHKQQLEILQQFPDTVPYDPERAAKAIEFEIESEPNFKAFIPNAQVEEEAEVNLAEEVAEVEEIPEVQEAVVEEVPAVEEQPEQPKTMPQSMDKETEAAAYVL